MGFHRIPQPVALDRAGLTAVQFPKLDWVIVGGESGPDARPMSIQWARELRDQCQSAGLPFFFKQWGEWRPAGSQPSGTPGRFAFGDYEHDRAAMIQVDSYPRQFTMFGARSTLERVGKKAAGRQLDGIEHNGMPGRPA
jgi:protein gp37